MADPEGKPLLLFVSGETDSGADPFRDVSSSVLSRTTGMMFGEAFGGKPAGSSDWKAAQDPSSRARGQLHLSLEESQCTRLVLEIAADEGRQVTVVDVNRADDHRDLVSRWVGPDELLPLLVRPDGARLAGAEQFVPKGVRRFIRAVVK